MNTGLKLGGIAALLLAGVFYTFAICVVEDVDEDVVMPEYMYVGKSYPDEPDIVRNELDAESAADLSENTAKSENKPKPSETAVTVKVNTSKFPDKEIKKANDEKNDIAVPVMAAVTTVSSEKSSYYETQKTENKSNEDNVDYPEDIDSDEYEDDSSEADEQMVYGDDTDEGGVLLKDDDEVDEPPVTTASVKEPEPDNNFTDAGNIIINIDSGNNDSNDDQGSGTPVGSGNAAQTFTAKFNGSTQTVNAYDLVCWIVNNEISESFSDEAIKAQAVAAYSYVKYHNDKGLTPSVLVKKNPSKRIQNMVSSVWGVCCYYNGSAAETVYMASSSGYTADAANVWGGSVPYLKSVACPFDAQSDPNYGLTMDVSESDMRSMLESALGIYLSDNPRNWIRITSYIDGNYVSTVDIDGQKTISGRKMRESVFSYKLKSASFDVSYSNGTFTFTTYGYGHGVGMSQNGANILAKQGYTYTEILKYYFTGIEIM